MGNTEGQKPNARGEKPTTTKINKPKKKKRPGVSRFALSRRTTLTNFVFQLSKTEVQKYEDEKLRRSLEPAHTNDEKAYCKTYSVYHTNGVAIRRQQADTC